MLFQEDAEIELRLGAVRGVSRRGDGEGGIILPDAVAGRGSRGAGQEGQREQESGEWRLPSSQRRPGRAQEQAKPDRRKIDQAFPKDGADEEQEVGNREDRHEEKETRVRGEPPAPPSQECEPKRQAEKHQRRQESGIAGARGRRNLTSRIVRREPPGPHQKPRVFSQRDERRPKCGAPSHAQKWIVQCPRVAGRHRAQHRDADPQIKERRQTI